MMERFGVRARFTLLYGIALIATVLMVSSGIYFFVERALTGQIENHLRKDMASIAEFLRNDLNDLKAVADHGPIDLFTVQKGGKRLVASDDWVRIGLDRALILTDGLKHGPHSFRESDGNSYLLQSSEVVTANGAYQVSVAHHESGIRQTLRTLGQIILLILPVAVILSLAIGYAIAGRVLAPITAITRKAEEIGADNLSERLPVAEGRDELTRLAQVFNQTFGRIEGSFQKLKRFTADASHELRTPLAAIRSIGETALHSAHDGRDCREAIGSILEEADRLRQLVDSLLVLSRGDAGGAKLYPETIRLAEIVAETIDFLSVLAEEKQQTVNFNPGCNPQVVVDRSTIRQTLTNILDNAIKYSPSGSRIQIAAGVSDHREPFVMIADNGPGISAEHLPHIFDRFYRVDRGRSRQMGGAGLGLAIAQWGAEINGARIETECQPGAGCLFKVIFPAVKQTEIEEVVTDHT